jgi:hypothetical protein
MKKPSSVVNIAWAIVAGRRSHIDDFDGLARADRPPSTCEECHGILQMRLGLRNANYFAHSPESKCRLRARESALHFNAVRWLGRELESRPPLVVAVRCGGWDHVRCPELITEQISVAWDEVKIEDPLTGVRPDVLLRRDGLPVLAIEVRANNRVSRDKADLYALLDLPWIEIQARFINLEWTPGDPLRVVEQRGAVKDSFCERHAERRRLVAEAFRRIS